MNHQIALRIHSVKCMDETGGSFAEKFGNDEIYLSGFGIDAGGATVKVPIFEVYAHFDDNDVKNFAPPRKFVTLLLGAGGTWPKSVTAGFLLCEKDAGGMGTALDKTFAKLQEELKKKKEEQEQKNKAMGLAASQIDWKTIWGVVKPILFGYVKDKLVSAINDDLFPLQSATISIPSATFSWNNSKVSPPERIEFRGHDGVYVMTYDWELS